MSGQHLLEDMSSASCRSVTGQMDVSSLKSTNRIISEDSTHLSQYTEGASDIQSPALYDGLCTVSEGCQSLFPENLDVKMCNGIDHYADVSVVPVQANSCKEECVLDSDVHEQHQQKLHMASKLDASEGCSSCAATVEFVGNSNPCIDALIRSNSFTETSSPDQSHVICAATRKLTGSPKPVLRRHSVSLSRTKKQVTIETNAEVIEIDTGTSEYPEIESGGIASAAGTGTDSIMSNESALSQMCVGTFGKYDHCRAERTLFNDCDGLSRSGSNIGNLPADKLSVLSDSTAVLQEVPVSSPQKGITDSTSDMDTTPPHVVELTSARRSYEVKCMDKPCVRRLVDDDDDSCGDEADDESTANEEELDSECKEEREHKRKRRKSAEDEIEKVVSSSPNGRFLKFDWEIGCGSFKTVYKGLDSETGVHIAWCELQVCNCCFS